MKGIAQIFDMRLGAEEVKWPHGNFPGQGRRFMAEVHGVDTGHHRPSSQLWDDAEKLLRHSRHSDLRFFRNPKPDKPEPVSMM